MATSSGMSGRERILTALELQQPDRVPLWELGFSDSPKIAEYLLESMPADRAATYLEPGQRLSRRQGLFIIAEELDLDGITALPVGRHTGTREGNLYTDRWGVVLQMNPYGIPYPVSAPIKDASNLKRFRPPKPVPEDLAFLEVVLERYGGQRAIFFQLDCCFIRGTYLRSMEHYLMDYILRPQMAHDIARMATDYTLELAGMAIDAGAEIIVESDDLAFHDNPLMSPAQFDEFVGPYLKELVDLVHGKGAKIIKHTDGNIWPILDAMVEMGLDGINPLEPRARMDLEKVKEHCGEDICLIGNIDCAHLLSFGTPDEVEEAVREAIRVAAPGGGYILCSSNSIHPGIPAENYVAMARATKKHGVY